MSSLKESPKARTLCAVSISDYLNMVKKQLEEQPIFQNAGMMKLKAPSTLYLEVTKRCGLHCKHCYSPKNTNTEFSFSEIEHIAHQCAKLGIFKVVLGGSETVLHKNFMGVVNIFSSNEILVDLTFSGFVSNQKLFEVKEICKQSKIATVQISLDSHIPSVHDEIRGMRGAWSRAINAIQNLGEHVPIVVATLLNILNVSKLEEHCYLLSKLPIKTLSILRQRGIAGQNFSPTTLFDIYTSLLDYDRYFKFGITAHDPLFETLKTKPCNCCTAGISSMAISCAQHAYSCPFLYSYDDYYVPYKDNILTVWNLLRREYEIPSQCKNCKHVKHCLGGCPALRVNNMPDPLCWHIQRGSQDGKS